MLDERRDREVGVVRHGAEPDRGFVAYDRDLVGESFEEKGQGGLRGFAQSSQSEGGHVTSVFLRVMARNLNQPRNCDRCVRAERGDAVRARSPDVPGIIAKVQPQVPFSWQSLSRFSFEEGFSRADLPEQKGDSVRSD